MGRLRRGVLAAQAACAVACSQTQRQTHIDWAVGVLNSALVKCDAAAIHALMALEVPANDSLARNTRRYRLATSMVRPRDGEYVLRPLGLINGLFGADSDSIGGS